MAVIVEVRAELSAAVAGLFRNGLPAKAPELTTTDRQRLTAVTTLAVRGRSAVERDGYSREVELIPDSESPARLGKVLARTLAGLHAIGADHANRMADRHEVRARQHPRATPRRR